MSQKPTTEEKQEAFRAADRYFEQMAHMADVPESLRQVASRPNPLFPIFYADGYLAGRQAERERHQSLRVAAKVILKRWDAVRHDEGAPIKALLPGLITIRAALRQAYGDE